MARGLSFSLQPDRVAAGSLLEEAAQHRQVEALAKPPCGAPPLAERIAMSQAQTPAGRTAAVLRA
jgi:hypothetical protein